MQFGMKSVIAAATLALLSTTAGAATLSVGSADTNVKVAQEFLDTGIITRQVPLTIKLGASNAASSNLLLKIDLAGAKFNAALTSGGGGNLLPGVGCNNGGTVTTAIEAGGLAGDGTVTYRLTFSAANVCIANDTMVLTLPQLKNVSSVAGGTVGVSGTLTNSSGGSAFDGGLTGAPTLLTVIDANKATAAAKQTTIDLAGGGKTFVVGNGTTDSVSSDGKTAIIGSIADVLDTTVKINDMATAITAAGQITGATLALANLPAGTTGVTLGTTSTDTSLANFSGAVACGAPAGNASACALTNADLIAMNGKTAAVKVVINGTSTLDPAGVTTATYTVNYAAPHASEEKIKAGTTLGTFGNVGCAVEFNTVLGAENLAVEQLSSMRVTNHSSVDAKVFVTATTDKGTSSGVPIQLTAASLGSLGENLVSDKLPGGATLEVLGSTLDGILFPSNATALTTGANHRGRVRFILDSNVPGAAAGSLGSARACSGEIMLCSKGICSLHGGRQDGTKDTVIQPISK